MAKQIFGRLQAGDKENEKIRQLTARVAELEAELASERRGIPTQEPSDLSISHDDPVPVAKTEAE